MPDPTRPHEDDLITVRISEAAAQVLRRATKRTRVDEHAIVDFAANLILGSPASSQFLTWLLLFRWAMYAKVSQSDFSFLH